MDPLHRSILVSELGLDEAEDVFEIGGILAPRDLMELVAIDDGSLHDAPLHPIEPPRVPTTRNIFHSIRDAGSLLVLHPYESFASTVERFLRELTSSVRGNAPELLAKIGGGDWSDETQNALADAVATFGSDFGYDLDEEGHPMEETAGVA